MRNGVILDLKLKHCRGQFYDAFLSVSINKRRLEGAAVSLFIVFILLHCPEANKYALTQHTSTNILRLSFTSILLQKDAANIIKECTNVIFTPISHFFSLEGAGSCHFINDCCDICSIVCTDEQFHLPFVVGAQLSCGKGNPMLENFESHCRFWKPEGIQPTNIQCNSHFDNRSQTCR